MFIKDIKKVTFQDIEDLIENKVQESRTIDFKESYSLESDKEKAEFLKDVSSLANEDGGYLIFGIKEENGRASKIKSLNISIKDEDKTKLKNESILEYGITPRIKIKQKFIEKNDKKVLIIKVQQSWNKPHRVIYKSYSKTKDQFYGRNTAGAYQMDLGQLREAFNLNERQIDQIKKFKNDRVFKIINNNTPVPLLRGGKAILHLIPLNNFIQKDNNYLSNIIKNNYRLETGYQRDKYGQINIDGFVTYTGEPKKWSFAYSQVFRNGSIEWVDSFMFNEQRWKEHEDNKKIILKGFEDKIVRSYEGLIKNMKELKISTPIFVSLTFTGLKDYTLQDHDEWHKSEKIDRDVIHTPEFLINSYDKSAKEVLKPMLDIIWNGCGYAGTKYFTTP